MKHFITLKTFSHNKETKTKTQRFFLRHSWLVKTATCGSDVNQWEASEASRDRVFQEASACPGLNVGSSCVCLCLYHVWNLSERLPVRREEHSLDISHIWHASPHYPRRCLLVWLRRLSENQRDIFVLWVQCPLAASSRLALWITVHGANNSNTGDMSQLLIPA